MALATALAWAAVSDWPPSTETPPLADAMPEATTLLIVRTKVTCSPDYPPTLEFLYEVVFFCWFL